MQTSNVVNAITSFDAFVGGLQPRTSNASARSSGQSYLRRMWNEWIESPLCYLRAKRESERAIRELEGVKARRISALQSGRISEPSDFDYRIVLQPIEELELVFVRSLDFETSRRKARSLSKSIEVIRRIKRAMLDVVALYPKTSDTTLMETARQFRADELMPLEKFSDGIRGV